MPWATCSQVRRGLAWTIPPPPPPTTVPSTVTQRGKAWTVRRRVSRFLELFGEAALLDRSSRGSAALPLGLSRGEERGEATLRERVLLSQGRVLFPPVKDRTPFPAPNLRRRRSSSLNGALLVERRHPAPALKAQIKCSPERACGAAVRKDARRPGMMP